MPVPCLFSGVVVRNSSFAESGLFYVRHLATLPALFMGVIERDVQPFFMGGP